MKTPAHILRKIFRKKGFTLVEIILASSIFTIVSVIGVSVFVNVTRIQRRVALENAMYEDGRFMMERIAREIRQNSIDYEEYYNKLVEKKQYGAEHGCYASRFYNPGSEGAFGAKCSIPPNGDPALNPGCVINKTTLDINTGQNPFTGNSYPPGNPQPSERANALCDEHFDMTAKDCTLTALHDRNELYLIDSKGEQKTILALKKINNSPIENSLGLIRLRGNDLNTDGVFEQWVDAGVNYFCAPGYNCKPGNFANDQLEDSLDGTNPAKRYEGFVPISPMRSNIVSLKFYVSPVEDPRKAFAETDITPPAPVIQQQPHVTIVMTLQPAANELTNFSGNIPTVTLQNTVSSRVYNEVKSYMGSSVTCSTGYT